MREGVQTEKKPDTWHGVGLLPICVCSRLTACSGVAAGPRAGVAALESAALVLAHPAPHAGVLAALERPREAVGDDGAAAADGLRLGDLKQRGTTVPNGEEQLGVLVAADRAVAPVHWNYSSARRAQRHAGCQRSFWGACECFHERLGCQGVSTDPVSELTQKIDSVHLVFHALLSLDCSTSRVGTETVTN